MKQTITPEQLDELSNEQKSKLNDWMQSAGYRSYGMVTFMHTTGKNIEGYVITPLSIGQLIQFLSEKVGIGYEYDSWVDYIYESDIDHCIDAKFDGELVDALWEAVKHKLSGVGE